jgi:hypothetical protein
LAFFLTLAAVVSVLVSITASNALIGAALLGVVYERVRRGTRDLTRAREGER